MTVLVSFGLFAGSFPTRIEARMDFSYSAVPTFAQDSLGAQSGKLLYDWWVSGVAMVFGVIIILCFG